MSTLRTDIIIATKAQNQGIESARAGILGLKSSLASLNNTASLVGIGLSTAAIVAFARRGVEFNATIETAQVGIAALLRQFQPEKFTNFKDAMVEAKGAVGSLRKEAATSPATFKQLLDGLQATSGAAFGAGISLEKQVKLINRISQTAATLGLKGDQIPQEARALFSGNIGADAQLAKSLGITKADIDTAKVSAGGLFDFLDKKLAAFAEATPFAAQTLDVQISNLTDTLDALAGRLAQPLSNALKREVADLQTYLSRLSDQDIRDIAEALADAAKAAGLLAKAIISAAPYAKDLAIAFAAIKLASYAISAQNTFAGIASARASLSAAPGVAGAAAAGASVVGAALSIATVAVASFEVGTFIAKSFGVDKAIGRTLADAGAFGNKPRTDSEKISEIVGKLAVAARTGDRERFQEILRNEADPVRKSVAVNSDFASAFADDANGLNRKNAATLAPLNKAIRKYAEILKRTTKSNEFIANIEADAAAKKAKADAEALRTGGTPDQQKTVATLTAQRDKLAFQNAPKEEQKRIADEAVKATATKLAEAQAAFAKDNKVENLIALLDAQIASGEAVAQRSGISDTPDKPEKRGVFTAADFAGDTARFGAFNFAPQGFAQGLPPNAQDEVRRTAERTADATQSASESLKRLVDLAQRNGGLTFISR